MWSGARKFNIPARMFDENCYLSIKSPLSETARNDQLRMGEANPFLEEQWILRFGFGKRRLAETCAWSMRRIVGNDLKRRLARSI